MKMLNCYKNLRKEKKKFQKNLLIQLYKRNMITQKKKNKDLKEKSCQKQKKKKKFNKLKNLWINKGKMA